MKFTLVCLMMVLSLISCQLYSFKDEFIHEVEKMKPKFTDKNLEKTVTKIAKKYLYKASIHSTIKTVDLNNVTFNHGLDDFERKIVQSKNLPASTHHQNRIIIGGLGIPGKTRRIKNDLYVCTVLVVKAKGTNTVSLLTYSLSIHFDKYSLGINLPEISDRDLAYAIFYHKLLKVIEDEPVRPKFYDFTKNVTRHTIS